MDFQRKKIHQLMTCNKMSFCYSGVTDCFKKCLDHVLSSLKQRPLANQLGGNIITGLRSGALLICGSGSGAGIGCGKTALAHAVCYQLQQWPVYAHITVVDCVPFRGSFFFYFILISIDPFNAARNDIQDILHDKL